MSVTWPDRPWASLWRRLASRGPLVAYIRVIARLTPERMRRERWTEVLQSDPVPLGGNMLIMPCIWR